MPEVFSPFTPWSKDMKMQTRGAKISWTFSDQPVMMYGMKPNLFDLLAHCSTKPSIQKSDKMSFMMCYHELEL